MQKEIMKNGDVKQIVNNRESQTNIESQIHKQIVNIRDEQNILYNGDL